MTDTFTFFGFARRRHTEDLEGRKGRTSRCAYDRRGHNASLLGDGWGQCKWCGTWLREVHTIEESEDAPPKGELGLMSKIEALQADPQPKKKKGKQKK